jgi:CHASE3 domain sensor protein
MTAKEEKTVEQLLNVVSKLETENRKFREDISKLVEVINNKVEKKHTPINFEQDILSTTQTAISSAISKVLCDDYNSPLKKLVNIVVDEHSYELKQIISESFSQVIKTDDFKKSIVNAFSHKVSRAIISNNDGLFDKVSNELKQDSIFKAKMSLAVANVVEECLTNKN